MTTLSIRPEKGKSSGWSEKGSQERNAITHGKKKHIRNAHKRKRNNIANNRINRQGNMKKVNKKGKSRISVLKRKKIRIAGTGGICRGC